MNLHDRKSDPGWIVLADMQNVDSAKVRLITSLSVSCCTAGLTDLLDHYEV